jgi:positive regulator of sigma E activity
LLARDREHTMEFDAVDRLGVEEGDEVILEVPSRRLSLTYLIVFGLPVLAMAAAFFLVAAIFTFAGRAGGEAAGIIAAMLVGFGAFWAGVKLADRRGLRPVIKEVVKAREGNGKTADEDGGFAGGVL